jgi:predicted PurR-regulated permease PerM
MVELASRTSLLTPTDFFQEDRGNTKGKSGLHQPEWGKTWAGRQARAARSLEHQALCKAPIITSSSSVTRAAGSFLGFFGLGLVFFFFFFFLNIQNEIPSALPGQLAREWRNENPHTSLVRLQHSTAM